MKDSKDSLDSKELKELQPMPLESHNSLENIPSSKEDSKPEPKFKDLVIGLSELTLGISIIVAILIGIGIGWGLERLIGWSWLFWLGVFWGVAAAVSNVHKAYKRQIKSFDEIKNNPRYNYKKIKDDEEDEDD